MIFTTSEIERVMDMVTPKKPLKPVNMSRKNRETMLAAIDCYHRNRRCSVEHWTEVMDLLRGYEDVT